MENEKTTMNDIDNSSAEKVIAPNHFDNDKMDSVNLEKDPGGFAIPDPDAHLSAEEKAAIVSFRALNQFLGAQLTL
jgi:hypothetical protein